VESVPKMIPEIAAGHSPLLVAECANMPTPTPSESKPAPHIPRYTVARFLLSMIMMGGWLATIAGFIRMFAGNPYPYNAVPQDPLPFILTGPLIFILWSLCMALFDAVALLADIRHHQVIATKPIADGPNQSGHSI
jgi:hypothetical protein